MANLTTGELNAMSPSEEDQKVRKALGVGASEEDIRALGDGAYEDSLERVEFEKFEPKTYGGMFDYNPDEEALKNKKSQGMPEKAAQQESFQYVMSQPQAEISRIRKVTNDLLDSGVSPEVQEAKARNADSQNDAVIDAHIEKVAKGEMSADEARDRLAQLPEVQEEDVSLFNEFYVMNLTRGMATTKAEKQDRDQKLAAIINDDFTEAVATAQRMEEMRAVLSDSAWDQTAGALKDMIPYATQVAVVNIVKNVTGKGIEEFSDVFLGQFTTKLRAQLKELPPDLRYLVSVDILDAIENSSGILGATDNQKLQIAYRLLSPEYGLLDQSIDNVISVLDAVGVGWTAAALWDTFRLGLRPGSNIDTLNMANPQVAARAAAAGITEDVSDIIQMKPSELVESIIYPSRAGADVTLLPHDVTRELNRARDITENLKNRTAANPMALTAPEKELSQAEFRKQMQTMNNNGLYDGNITMKYGEGATEGFIEYAAKMGYRKADGTIVPFGTPAEAIDNAFKQFPDAKGVGVYSVSATKGLKIVPKNKFKSAKAGQYVYEIHGAKSQVDIMAGGNALMFNPGDVKYSGLLAKTLLDADSRYAKYIAQGYHQSADWAKGIAVELATIAKPFEKISSPKQRQVVRLLQDFSKDPTWDTATLITKAGDDMDVVRGFFSIRKTFDALYHLENRSFRQSLIDQKGKQLNIGAFQGAGFARSDEAILSEIRAGKLAEVFNPRTSSNIPIDAAELIKLRKKNYNFYQLLEPHGTTRNRTSYVIAKADDVSELPMNVLKYQPGYFPRYYKDTYFVKGTVSGVSNGVRSNNIDTMVAALPSRADALRKVDDLKKEDRFADMELEIVHDRSLKPQDLQSINMQDAVSLQRMFYHKKGTHLPGIDGLSEISDPIEALVKNIDSTARHVAHRDINKTMKERWMNYYGDKLGLVNTKLGFPMSKAEIGATSGSKHTNDAISAWEHIRLSEGAMVTEQVGWKNFWVRMADWLQGDSMTGTVLGNIKKPAAAALVWFSNNSVNKLLRTLAFQHLIALNPFRHHYVQAKQFLFIAAIAPTSAPKIMLQNKAVMMGLAKDAVPELYKVVNNQAAKAMGMSTQEFDTFIKKFKETGLPHSVDSHDFVRDSMVEFSKNVHGNVGSDLARKAGNMVKAPFKIAKEVGFNYGELSNLVSTFLLARVKYLAKTGKKQLKTQQDYAQVAADARSYALSMTKSGAFRYQEGFLSALTQFLSIQHKGILVLTGFNKHFTREERLRILVGQVVLNGVTGLGLYETYKTVRDYHGLDVDEELEPWIIGGMYETLINKTIELATGEESTANISEALSPVAGVNQSLGDYWDVLLGNKPLMEIMAATNVINRYTDAAKTMKAMYDHPNLGDEGDLAEMVSVLGTVTSGWSQALRANAAYRLGVHVSSSGNPSVQANFASALLEGVYGITPRGVGDLHDLSSQFRLGTKKELTLWADPERGAEAVASDLYSTLRRVVTLHRDSFDADIAASQQPEVYKLHQQTLRDALALHTSVLSLYDPIEQDRIWQAFRGKVMKERVQGKETVIDDIIKLMHSGEISDPDKVNYTINQIRNSGMMDTKSPRGQQQELAIRFILRDMYSRRGLSSALEEEVLNGKN